MPIGKAGCFYSVNKDILQVFFLFAALHLLEEYESPGPLVLVQHKGHERIGEARTPICRTSLTDFAVLTRN